VQRIKANFELNWNILMNQFSAKEFQSAGACSGQPVTSTHKFYFDSIRVPNVSDWQFDDA